MNKYLTALGAVFLSSLLVMGVQAREIIKGDAPDFSLPDLEGKSQSLDDYPGKVVIVNYWATWCPPCLEELPELAVFHEDHKDRDAVVLGIDFEDISKEKLAAFVEEQMLDYPVMQVEPKPATPFGELLGLPTTYIISADRKTVRRHIGPVTMDHLNRYLAEGLDKK